MRDEHGQTYIASGLFLVKLPKFRTKRALNLFLAAATGRANADWVW